MALKYHNYKKPKSCIFGLVTLASTSFFAHGNELPDFTEEDLFIDIPTVVSATRQPQKLTETPVAISIIDQQLIKASGAQKITELFQLVPGMQSYNSSANIGAVSYHAVSDDHPRRMEVMLNGHSVYLPLLSTVAWETLGITINDIDHIEVIRGSNVPAYGSNAFLGAINIVTKNPLTSSESTLETTQGALDTQKYYASFQSGIGSVEYILSANYDENDGYHFYDDGILNRSINLTGTATPTLTDTITFNLGVSDGKVNIGQSDDLDNLFSPREHFTHYQHLSWTHIVDETNEIKLNFTHNYVDLDAQKAPVAEVLALELGVDVALAEFALQFDPTFIPLAGTEQYIGTEHGVTELYDIELQHTIDNSSEIKSVWGLGYRAESAESEVLLSGLGKVRADKWRLFGNTQWQPNSKLTFNLGGMFEKSNLANTRFSPRVAANYAISNSLSVRTAVTQAYRTPSLLEKNSSAIFFDNTQSPWDIVTQADPDLKPEKLTSYGLGLFKLWPESKSHLDIRIFNEQISGAIDDKFEEGTGDVDNRSRRSSNTAFWRNVGAELQAAYRPTPASIILFNYGYNNVKGERDRGTRGIDSLDDAGTPPSARSPLHTASLLFSSELEQGFSASLGQYFMSSVNWLEGGYRPTFQRTDFVLAKEFQLNYNSSLETKLVVQNLFDSEYEDFYPYNIFDRRTFLQLKLSY